MCGVLLFPPVLQPDGFESLTVGERAIGFLGVFPLYESEISEALVVRRPSVA